MVIVFILGYTAIALEHPLKVNKSATALIMGTALWVLLIIGGESVLVDKSFFRHFLEETVGGTFINWISSHMLLESLGEISEILFFLLGAMTIVELIDSFEGFRIITDKIKTTKRIKLLWIISILTFFMSAALDNLTTSIVMVALLRKLISDRKDRWFFAGMVIVAANAGGAWSPIGDVTTIMLWIAGKVTTGNIIIMTILPSLVSMVVPLILLSFTMKGHIQRPEAISDEGKAHVPVIQRNAIFFIGVGALLFVPVFKTLTHLPPYLGMLFGLGTLWLVTEILNARRHEDTRERAKHLTVVGVLQKVDVPSVLFFLGILTAVHALQTAGHLILLADYLRESVGNLYVINIIIGVLSSIVDNVPLVAGAMGMYTFPADHYFWEFLAYCAGTGGSILIIGSAAGVAVMGMEKIDFIWYMKRISLLALVGYLAGAGVYYVQNESGVFHKHEEAIEARININDKEAILDYLTAKEFYYNPDVAADEILTHEIEDGYHLHFMDIDDIDGRYIGYSIRQTDGCNEGWDGKFLKSDIEINNIDNKRAEIRFLDKTFILNTAGELIEKRIHGSDRKLHIEWSTLEGEGH